MPVAEETRGRAVAFAEDDVADNREACGFPSVHEQVDLVRAVERNAQAVGPQHAVHLAEGRFKPRAVVAVIRPAAAGAVAVVHQVRRISKDEIDARPRKAAHDLDAVAVDDAVEGNFLPVRKCHCLFSFFGSGFFPEPPRTEGTARVKAVCHPGWFYGGNGQHGTTAGRNGAGSAVDRPPRPFTIEASGSRGNTARGTDNKHESAELTGQHAG